jgi:predicted dehydrogenase
VTTHSIAVVGCGRVSAMHFAGAAAHPGEVTVVAACDPVPDRLAWAQAQHGVPQTFSSVEQMLEEAEFQTAIVCTPTHIRLPAVRALAEAGKNVLVEKPLAEGFDEAAGLVSLCDKAGVRLAVNQNFRDYYPFGLAREIIARGELGAVTTIVHQDLSLRQEEGWRVKAQRHALSVMGVHWLDGFRYLLGREADLVTASVVSSAAVDAAGDTDAQVLLHFGQTTVSYVQSFSSRIASTGTTIIGELGTLALDYAGAKLVTAAGETVIANPYAGRKAEAAYHSLRQLLDSGEPGNSGRDNLFTIALLDAVYRSAETGSGVSL